MTALITGAAKGIGRASALALAKDGYSVAVHYHTSETEALKTLSLIREAGGRAEAFCADLANHEACQHLVKQAEAQLGPIQAFVSNAGMLKTSLLALTSFDEWRAVLSINLDAPFLLTKMIARSMARQRSGRIIYISSDAALTGDLLRSAYSASKSGILGLAKTVARELAPSGITVNVICPGLIQTDMTREMDEGRRATLLGMIPLQRFGTPEEVAGVVRFLASDQASWITGQILSVDGGLYTK